MNVDNFARKILARICHFIKLALMYKLKILKGEYNGLQPQKQTLSHSHGF